MRIPGLSALIHQPLLRAPLFALVATALVASADAQTTYPESTSPSDLPIGVYYQPGPGGNNAGYNWTYRYGTKLTVNGGSFRNFEIGTTIYPYGDLVFRQWVTSSSTWGSWLKILAENENENGNVGIGTTSPGNKLEVNGTIRSKEVIVESTNWPDYVFEDGYALPSLEEVENHIEERGRLPGMPSAEEVAESGVSLGGAQRMILEKVEELTLYVIDLQKQNDELKSRVRELEVSK